jgi:hypothetical protein
VQVRATSGVATHKTKFAALTASMAAKAALAFLLLATAAAYSSQRVPIDAQRSHVVAAERRRRFNAAAALIGAAAAAPSTARAITWKVASGVLAFDESRRWRGGGFDSTRSITWRSAIRRRRDGPAPTQDDREDVNAVFVDKYPKAILIESGIALVILALSKAGVGPLAEKFKEGD